MQKFGVVTSAYEAVVQELAALRPPIDNLDTKLFSCGGPRPNTLIEISGFPNSGKTELLTHIMARCLPPTYFDCKYSDILFINMGHKFSIPKFREYLKRFICESKEKCTLEECNEVIESSLESTTVLNCYSANEFDLSFDLMEDILFKNRYINLIAIDDLDAFYWHDTFQKLVKMRSHYAKMIARLRSLCETHKVCCAYTVNSNYLEFRKSTSSSNYAKISPEYTFRLKLLPNGSRTLNDSAITINESGIRFLDKT